MPTQRKPVSVFSNWLKEEPSVVESKWEEPIRKTMNMIGSLVGGPEDLINPITTGPVSPLISIFKNKIARHAGNVEFLNSINEFALNHPTIGPYIRHAALDFEKRYPRVAAHIRMNPDLLEDPTTMAYMEMASSKVTEPLRMGIGRTGYEELAKSVNPQSKARELLFHEGTHAAQNLGNSDYENLYLGALRGNVIDRGMPMHEAYLNIPFERTAKYRGLKESGLTGLVKPEPVLTSIKDLRADPEVRAILEKRSSPKRGIISQFMKKLGY